MAIHDAWARLTPYELSFPDLDTARERLREIDEEVRARGVDVGDPDLFVLLGGVGQALRDLRPDDDPAEGIGPFGLLLFHAFHFWGAGEPVYLIETPLLRSVAESAGAGNWPAGLGSAGYVQFPQHLIWADGAEEGRPESVDGFFWTVPAESSEVHVLLVAGLRGDRPGFSVIPLGPAPLAGPAAAPGDDGTWPDLVSTMPGAELEGLYHVRTADDVLRLAAGALARIAGAPSAEAEPPPLGAGPPRPTALPYRRVGPG